jgi:hypothetical protein
MPYTTREVRLRTRFKPGLEFDEGCVLLIILNGLDNLMQVINNLSFLLSFPIYSSSLLTITSPFCLLQTSGGCLLKSHLIESSTIEIYPPRAGDAIVTVFDISGRQISQNQSYLDKSTQVFNLSGPGKGLYIIHVNSI